MPGRFNSIFFAAHGQTDAQVGLLLAAPSMVSLVAGPLLCNFADRLRRRELIAGLAHIATTTAFLAQIVALPSLNWLSPQMRFPLLMTLRIVFGCFNAGVYPLVCAIAIAQLRKEHGIKGYERFGEERLWGAVSWAVCALTLGYVLDLPNVGIEAVYVGVLVFSVAFLITLWCFAHEKEVEISSDAMGEDNDGTSLLVPDIGEPSSDRERNDAETSSRSAIQPESSSLEAVSRIVSAGGVPTMMFFNLIFWLAGGMSLVGNLLFLFLQHDLHASNFVCGLSVVITVVFEIPLFALAPKLLQKIGAPALAIVGSVSYVLRCVVYSIAPNAWVVLLVEPLHGVTYSAAAMAGVAFVAYRTPPELEATGQSILSAVRALGSTIGVALGGYVMEHFGSKVLYRSAAASVLTAAVIFAACDPSSLRMPSGCKGPVTARSRTSEEDENVRHDGANS